MWATKASLLIFNQIIPKKTCTCRYILLNTHHQKRVLFLINGCNMNPLNLQIRTSILKCYMFTILMNGVEGWSLTDAVCNHLEPFEMWSHRRMLSISWTHHITNESVLQCMKRSDEDCQKEKMYIRHIMRNNKCNILQLII